MYCPVCNSLFGFTETSGLFRCVSCRTVYLQRDDGTLKQARWIRYQRTVGAILEG